MFLLLPLIIYIPVGIYLAFFCRRFLTLFGMNRKGLPSILISIVFAVACAAAGWQVYGLGAVVVLHFTAIGLVLELINLIVKKTLEKKGENKVWDFLIRSGLLVVAAMVIIFSYGYFNIKNIQRTEYDLETGKNIPDKFRIAQISDLHMGTTMDAQKLQQYCDQIQEEQPDLVALTGDIFDERTSREDMEEAVQILAGIQSTYGTYYVFGNHDYNSYVAAPYYTAEELSQTLTDAGIQVLDDKAIQVSDEIAVIGRNDRYMPREDITALTAQVDPDSFLLLLDHQPVGMEENQQAGIDLQLSGHTHAGQVWPIGLMTELGGGMNYGLYQMGDYQLVVSSGIAGWGYAMRTGGHSEYVIINITQK